MEAYPIRGAGDRIIEDTVQWVGGDNAALKYRGNALKREKIWLQRGPVSNGYAYMYTDRDASTSNLFPNYALTTLRRASPASCGASPSPQRP